MSKTPNEQQAPVEPAIIYDSLYSEAMSEIISRNPGFLINWALLIFLSIILLLFSTTWFIQYPDIIKTRASLVATNAPKEVISMQDGRLVRLFAHNGQTVVEGDILIFMESTAKHEQVVRLSRQLDSTISDLQQNNTQFIILRFAKSFDQMGELQLSYQQFITAYQQFSDYLQNGYYLKKKRVLEDDISYLKKSHSILQQQQELILQDLRLSEDGYKANEQLYRDKVISRQDERNEQSKLLNKQLSLPQINALLLNNEIQRRDKQKEIVELEHSIAIQKTIFLQATQTLKSLIDDWEKKYIIKAPVSGKLTILAHLQDNEYIKSGKSLGFVSPLNSKYYADITIPQYNFGKADTNQTVQLRFDAYPFQEFGFVTGRIKYISDIPNDSGFVAHVQMPFGLFTNQKKEIKYREGLKAEALIITKNMRLAERFYYNLTSTLNR